MTQTAIQTATIDAAITETVLIRNDLSGLTADQRVSYYGAVCKSLGLNPLTQPFSYLTLNNKLVLYAKRDCTDQLRKINGISIVRIEREQVGDVYSVTAYARTANGREDSSIGAVFVGTKKGEDFANAMMKAETKAKRRVTLSISGLGMLDETEVETIPDARPAPPVPVVAPAPAIVGTIPIERINAVYAAADWLIQHPTIDTPEAAKALRDHADATGWQKPDDVKTAAQARAAFAHYVEQVVIASGRTEAAQ
jgi:hypothetical protein